MIEELKTRLMDQVLCAQILSISDRIVVSLDDQIWPKHHINNLSTRKERLQKHRFLMLLKEGRR